MMSDSMSAHYRVPEDSPHQVLSSWSPGQKDFCGGGKEEGLQLLQELKAELARLQDVLFAGKQQKVLILLQGMDASGKDGTIRNVFNMLNPQGVRVTTFTRPSKHELSHDFLWRIHQQVPANGEMVIFNRSHYEDVLAVRVRKLMPESVWQRRYDHINAFERLLSDEGTLILKFYLHIGKEEQKRRLLARQQTPHKQWKLEPADIEDRQLWTQYIDAYEEVLKRTSRPSAPWFVIPANRKWYRDVLIASIVVEQMRALQLSYPPPDERVSELVID